MAVLTHGVCFHFVSVFAHAPVSVLTYCGAAWRAPERAQHSVSIVVLVVVLVVLLVVLLVVMLVVRPGTPARECSAVGAACSTARAPAGRDMPGSVSAACTAAEAAAPPAHWYGVCKRASARSPGARLDTSQPAAAAITAR